MFGSWCRVLLGEISVLVREAWGALSPSTTLGCSEELAVVALRKPSLSKIVTRTSPFWLPDLGNPASRPVRNRLMLFLNDITTM